MSKPRRFTRREPKLSIGKLFLLSAEGEKTELQYFTMFNDKHSIVKVKCLKKSSGSSPKHVLKKMKDELKKVGLKNTDEAWLVVDKDQWTDEQLTQLHKWSIKEDNYGFALSNPKFEYWLLLHFEDGDNVNSAQRCTDKLRKHLPNYDKTIDKKQLSHNKVRKAIERAKEKDNPPCSKWPPHTGTTVYRLVDNILKAKEKE